MSPRVASSQPTRHHSAKSCPPPANGSQIWPSTSSYEEETLNPWRFSATWKLYDRNSAIIRDVRSLVQSAFHFGTHRKHPADFLCTSALPRSPPNIIIKNMYDKRQLEARPGQHAKSGQDISHQQPGSPSQSRRALGVVEATECEVMSDDELSWHHQRHHMMAPIARVFRGPKDQTDAGDAELIRTRAMWWNRIT